MTTKSAMHRNASHCNSHQRQRNDHWVWIESERDSGPYGSRESTIVSVRLVATASVAPHTTCDHAGCDDSGAGTDVPVASVQVDVSPRVAGHGSISAGG